MKLFGSFTSPFVRHCRIALQEEKIPFELVETDYQSSAEHSPTKRVPFLQDGDAFLSDSTSILFHVRQGHLWNSSQEAEIYCLANTALDTGINLFLLERDGITPEKSAYLTRQSARLARSFQELDRIVKFDSHQKVSDAMWRVACLLAWVNYRKRFDFSHLNNLCDTLKGLQDNVNWQQTKPPPL